MTHTYDLTNGSISAHLIRLAAPLIVGNLLQQLYNAADVFILGHFAGSAEFAAAGIAGSVMNFFLFAVVGGCTGISILLAQYFGSEDRQAFRQEHFLSLVMGLGISALLGGAGILLMKPMLALIQVPDTLARLVRWYLCIVLAGLPVSFLYNLYSALLRAAGRTQAALLALAAAVCINLLLDCLFIRGLHAGIGGAAAATVLSQMLSAIFCLLYLKKQLPALLFTRKDCRMNRAILSKTIRCSFVTGLHQSSLYFGKLMVQGAVNAAGTAAISAYTAATRTEGFINSFGDSGAAATSIVVAQNVGAQKKERVRKTFRESAKLLLLFGLLCSAALFLLARPACTIFLGADDPEALEQAVSYLHLISFFYPLCFLGNTFAGYFDGTGQVLIPFIGAASHISLRAVLSWLLVRRFGLNTVAVATGLGWIWVNLLWAFLYFIRSRSTSHSLGV